MMRGSPDVDNETSSEESESEDDSDEYEEDEDGDDDEDLDRPVSSEDDDEVEDFEHSPRRSERRAIASLALNTRSLAMFRDDQRPAAVELISRLENGETAILDDDFYLSSIVRGSIDGSVLDRKFTGKTTLIYDSSYDTKFDLVPVYDVIKEHLKFDASEMDERVIFQHTDVGSLILTKTIEHLNFQETSNSEKTQLTVTLGSPNVQSSSESVVTCGSNYGLVPRSFTGMVTKIVDNLMNGLETIRNMASTGEIVGEDPPGSTAFVSKCKKVAKSIAKNVVLILPEGWLECAIVNRCDLTNRDLLTYNERDDRARQSVKIFSSLTRKIPTKKGTSRDSYVQLPVIIVTLMTLVSDKISQLESVDKFTIVRDFLVIRRLLLSIENLWTHDPFKFGTPEKKGNKRDRFAHDALEKRTTLLHLLKSCVSLVRKRFEREGEFTFVECLMRTLNIYTQDDDSQLLWNDSFIDLVYRNPLREIWKSSVENEMSDVYMYLTSAYNKKLLFKHKIADKPEDKIINVEPVNVTVATKFSSVSKAVKLFRNYSAGLMVSFPNKMCRIPNVEYFKEYKVDAEMLLRTSRTFHLFTYECVKIVADIMIREHPHMLVEETWRTSFEPQFLHIIGMDKRIIERVFGHNNAVNEGSSGYFNYVFKKFADELTENMYVYMERVMPTRAIGGLAVPKSNFVASMSAPLNEIVNKVVSHVVYLSCIECRCDVCTDSNGCIRRELRALDDNSDLVSAYDRLYGQESSLSEEQREQSYDFGVMMLRSMGDAFGYCLELLSDKRSEATYDSLMDFLDSDMIDENDNDPDYRQPNDSTLDLYHMDMEDTEPMTLRQLRQAKKDVSRLPTDEEFNYVKLKDYKLKFFHVPGENIVYEDTKNPERKGEDKPPAIGVGNKSATRTNHLSKQLTAVRTSFPGLLHSNNLSPSILCATLVFATAFDLSDCGVIVSSDNEQFWLNNKAFCKGCKKIYTFFLLRLSETVIIPICCECMVALKAISEDTHWLRRQLLERAEVQPQEGTFFNLTEDPTRRYLRAIQNPKSTTFKRDKQYNYYELDKRNRGKSSATKRKELDMERESLLRVEAEADKRRNDEIATALQSITEDATDSDVVTAAPENHPRSVFDALSIIEEDENAADSGVFSSDGANQSTVDGGEFGMNKPVRKRFKNIGEKVASGTKKRKSSEENDLSNFEKVPVRLGNKKMQKNRNKDLRKKLSKVLPRV
ncbi:hypothetical protein QAD02_001421 [Eretmocerus hayati]|uniref:Uncharacterized protein n=1 Tax=Eretmocerus hayati TaxID=131215 RepID=A0ACC2NGE7_9HYME|nr:hypothetical protein QAD02_001421 [Eretmocerus hayati]